MSRGYVFQEKSAKFYNQLRRQKGENYANLILEEAKGVIYKTNVGYVFSLEQVNDISRILKLENQDIVTIPIRDKHNEVEYYKIKQRNKNENTYFLRLNRESKKSIATKYMYNSCVL